MRLLYISKYAVSPLHGTVSRQYLYCKYLAERPNNEVLLVSSRSAKLDRPPKIKGTAQQDKHGNLVHRILNGPLISLGFNLRRVFSWLWFEVQLLRSFVTFRRWKPDIILVSSLSILTFLSGIILKKTLRIPLVVEVRDIYPLTLQEVGNFKKWNPFVLLLGWIEKVGYRSADQIISSLPNLSPHVEEVLGFAKPVIYMPMGHDPEQPFSPEVSIEATSAMEKIDNAAASLNIGYCGTLGQANALKEPLETFAEFKDELSGIHFWLIGDGPLAAKYEAKYKDCDNIHFLGRFPKAQLDCLLDKFDVVINPWLKRPIYRYGISPNKWIDYMHAGKPILVAYDDYPFLIDDAKIGWFITPECVLSFKAALQTISRSPRTELRKRGNNGKQYLESHLSYRVLSEKLDLVLQNTINNYDK